MIRRGALIGVGNVAVNGHLPGWLRRPDVVLSAAADTRSDGRRVLESAVPGIVWYDSAETLLERENLDFVDVCTPPAAHGGAIARALERGISVLCEKPLVLRHEDLLSLWELARQKGRALATVHKWHHAPPLARARELVGSGALGRVTRCRWEVLRERPAIAATDRPDANWRLDPAISGGGILVDHGWHAIYAVASWFEEPPLRVSAKLSTRKHRRFPVDDTAEVELEFAGARAEIFLTWAADRRENRIEIDGTRGCLRLEGRTLELRSEKQGPRRFEFSEALSEGSHHPEWFDPVAAAFLAEVDDPDHRGTSLEEASLCLSVIEAAGESNRSGQPVAPASFAQRVGARTL